MYQLLRIYNSLYLGNIAADPGGNSVVNIVDNQVKLTGDAEDSVAGRSMVIYENEGDGSRLKCCTIRVDYIPPN